MAREDSEQSRILRTRLLGRMGLLLVAWSAVFALTCVVFELYISDDLGNRIADQTSQWIQSSTITNSTDAAADIVTDVAPENKEDNTLTYEEMVEAKENAEVIGDDIALDYYHRLADKVGGENVQLILTEDGHIAMRDLSTYYTIRSLKIPLALLVYAIGFIVIIILTLNRSLSYVNDLSNAISNPRLIEGGRVELPKELTITSQQIELLQKKIRDHEQAAVMAEQRKNELVAYLAHDIRTPLTSVVGYLSLLAESPDLPREKRAQFAGIALAKAERLESLVEEFFEITRYNLDAIFLERENVDICLFLEQVADEFGTAAHERGITITTMAPENEQAFIDPSKMGRALGNVVKNAVSYADANTEVIVSAVVEDSEMVFSTSNHGREISAVHLEAIFERFYREDRSRGQGANAGLGLAIAREIVEAHNGTIVAESTNGLTTFTIRLPR